MAERRMFAKSITNSARFLRLPVAARLLYYDLGMNADDDGVAEAFVVLRTTGATEQDLRALEEKGFVTVLNDDLVTAIVDWQRNNQIRTDRYKPSIYQQILLDRGLPVVNHGEPDDSIGKGRRDKGRRDMERTAEERQGDRKNEGRGFLEGGTGGTSLDGDVYMPPNEQDFEKLRDEKIAMLSRLNREHIESEGEKNV